MRASARLLALLVAFLVPSLLPVLALATPGAAPRPHYRLDVSFDPAERLVRGTMVLEVQNPTAQPLAALELWLFPERLARLSPALDEHNFYWAYPRSFNPGGIALAGLTVDGAPVTGEFVDVTPAGPRTLLRVPLARPLAPGATARLQLAFTTRIPRRYGSFGCHRKGCTLAGGFHPLLASLGPEGFDRSAPPALADYDLSVRAPQDVVVLLGGEERRSAHLERALHALVQLDWSPFLRRLEIEHRGVSVRLFHHRRLSPPPPPPPGRAGPYVVEDRAALLLDAARGAIDLLAETGLALPAGARVALVETPLRMELALAQEGAVLVSDQLFRIGPLKRFRKFHEFQLVRAIFNLLLEERLKERERPDDLGWSPDVGASWLTDLYTVREYRKEESARDVLKWVSFIPTVDQLLYAPQVQFASTYFNTLDEPDPTRADLRRFMNQRPRGKTLYEKLRDLLGDERMARVGRALYAGTPIREAAEAEHGAPLGDFFAQWLGPYPDVDYAFTLGPPEAVQGGFRYRLRVYKRGPHPPVEPVEVRVIEWGGAKQTLRWDGHGQEHVLTVETKRPIRTVLLDPRGRLLERIAGTEADLRLNNRRPGRWKFIYNDIGALFSLQTLSLDLSIDFTLQRAHDVHNRMRFALFRDRQAQVGLLVSYLRGLGRLVTPARTEAVLIPTLRLSRLQPAFGRQGQPAVPGTQLTLGLTFDRDDRLFIWEPWRATFFGGSASYTLTLLDDRRVLHQATLSANFGRIVPIVTGHGFAFQLNAAATFGNLVVPTQLLTAGGANWLRGYAPDELLGRLRLFGRAEYRHVFLHDLNLNFLHIAYIRGVSGGLFLEAAAISPCGGYRPGTRDLFGNIGYSLRFQVDWLGVIQSTLNFDVAVPLVRRQRECVVEEGQPPTTSSARSPIGFFVFFGPVF